MVSDETKTLLEFKDKKTGNSLAVQRLGLSASGSVVGLNPWMGN